MFYIVQIGILLAGATVVLHAAGTFLWVHLLIRSRRRLRAANQIAPELSCQQQNRLQFRVALRAIFVTTVAIIGLHVTEVLLWASAYCWVLKGDDAMMFADAVYFSMVTFTTLGYGDIVIESHWRLLAGIEAMAGMIVFGWSSAMLYAAVSQAVAPRISQAFASESETD